MATTGRAAITALADEPDIELAAFEEPLDPLFPRLPNVVSRRGHRAVKLKVRVDDREVIPPNATAVTLKARIVSYGPERIGGDRHLFRHRVLWGMKTETIILDPGHGPEYNFEIVVEKSVSDDHLGEGPYEAAVKVTASSDSVTRTTDSDEPEVTVRFISM